MKIKGLSIFCIANILVRFANRRTRMFAILFCFTPLFVSAQTTVLREDTHKGSKNFTISGKITDQKGSPLVGANVLIKNTNIGTITDEKGSFSLQNVTEKGVLVCSFVGFFPTEINFVGLENPQGLEIILKENPYIKGVEILGTKDYPTTMAVLDKTEIGKNNLAQDLPILLNFTPSLVSFSDAGAGVGYTAMRIRGSDATRTNVTINGIPINDSESQGVFWVNMPDLASSASNIQIQRGVGTSTNGAGAFGASLNIETQNPDSEAFAEINNTYGSFNTWKHNLKFGTGLIKNKVAIEGRLSKISSDGFIDRASSDLKSFFISGIYKGKRKQLKINVFSGQERTYQAWNGIPEEILRKGNRTYNELTYENEIDNYQQDHYQAFYDQDFGKNWHLNLAAHYTYGRGYFEQYKADQSFSSYGLQNAQNGSETLKTTDLIRRRWLDNDFYGAVYNLTYKNAKLDLHFGGAWNIYEGKHFGEVIWAKNMSNGQIRHRYYDNDARKIDFNTFAKANYEFLPNTFAFVDLQVRSVNYQFLGYNNELQNVQQKADLLFFNPKLGFRYRKNQHDFYASYAVGNKEPNRQDFTESTPTSRPKAENLQNVELGYTANFGNLSLFANYYLMYYKDQLVLTGQINDVGAYIRTNIPDSYRTGLELGTRLIFSNLTWNANLALSRNKIQKFTEYLDDYDNGGQKTISYENTDLAFSPSIVAGSELEYRFKSLKISLLSKYVSDQYLDNTQSESRKLKAFATQDLRITYSLVGKSKEAWFENLTFNLLINNLLNTQYEPNGYTFGYIAGQETVRQNYYYPQAGTNFLLGVGIRF